MPLIFSFLHVIVIGLADALIKGNIIASHNNRWEQVPWYFKDENLIYPALVFLVFGLILGLFVKRKFRWGWSYIAMLVIWTLGGLESLSYWLGIHIFKINQTIWWLPDSSFFWWYPREAPWLNHLYHLKLISFSQTLNPNVTREAVLYGIIIAACLNVLICLYARQKR